ncbi:MAG: NAD(P)-binding domain-containing protein, partial [Candidatus Eremiobacteraeota bacterium]|nr:NAD(P)-binding domain-containing protein [Candidatus Eremiobacteraeota bacterium]
GSGDVAKALGDGFLGRGDAVMLGTRDANKLKDWLEQHPKASVGSFKDAATFGELIVLATLGSADAAVIASADAASFAGKVVIDATNPLRFDETGPHLSVGFDDSLGEQVQRALPGARVVKAFNTVGAPHMVRPQFDGGPPSMFIGGDDDAAKQTVTTILRDFGWDVVDLGGIDAARCLEPMCLAWVEYGRRNGTWNHAFKLLRG